MEPCRIVMLTFTGRLPSLKRHRPLMVPVNSTDSCTLLTTTFATLRVFASHSSLVPAISRGNILDTFHGGFERDGFKVKLFDVPGMSHDICDDKTLARAVDFFEGGS